MMAFRHSRSFLSKKLSGRATTRPAPWGRTAKLERELQTQLYRSASTGTDNRVRGGYVRCCASASERTSRGIIVGESVLPTEWIGKVGMVENVEELRAELCTETLAELQVLGYGKVHILESRVPEDVASHRSEGAERGRNHYRCTGCVAPKGVQ